MQISETGLNKGFTLLEIIIVLTIISVASTSFYLLLRQPAPEENLEDKIDYYRVISLYTGSTYAFSKDSINTRPIIFLLISGSITPLRFL